VTHHLAQINIGRIVAPVDDPKIAGFMAQLDRVNALAEAAPGFVWRLQSSSGNATDVPYNDDPFVLVNMSVWESVEALRDYVYRSRHVEVLRDRAQWFQKMEMPHYCLLVGARGSHSDGGGRTRKAGALSAARTYTRVVLVFPGVRGSGGRGIASLGLFLQQRKGQVPRAWPACCPEPFPPNSKSR